MSKTVTLRIDEKVYRLFKTAANGERRSLANFIETAALNYLTGEIYADDREMEEILSDAGLLRRIDRGIKESQRGDYRFVD